MLLTDDDLKARYKELQSVTIVLDADPVKEGLASINRKIAEIQAQKERIGALYVEAIKNKSEAEILLEAKKGEHGRQLDELLFTDEDVKSQKSAELRKAAANVKTKDLVVAMAYAELDQQKADTYYKCVQQVYGHLESANANLSRQISVIQMGVQLGEISKEAAGSLFGRTVNVK
jgi:dTDP-4-amino-4,6-dideoxygalactose transaminase